MLGHRVCGVVIQYDTHAAKLGQARQRCTLLGCHV